MRKKSAQFLTILILVMGGICFSGCDKDNEEDPLGASRPIYNMLSDLSKGDIGLCPTEWECTNTFSKPKFFLLIRMTYGEGISLQKVTGFGNGSGILLGLFFQSVRALPIFRFRRLIFTVFAKVSSC